MILDKTNFYAEMGGQVGDAGEFAAMTAAWCFVVRDHPRRRPSRPAHRPRERGRIRVAEGVTAHVMGGRERTEKNHTATHLANWALRETLGDHVQQKGSLVDSEKLRFDFVHPKSMGDEEIATRRGAGQRRHRRPAPGLRRGRTAGKSPQDLRPPRRLRRKISAHGPRRVHRRARRRPAQIPENPEWKKFSIEFCGGTHLPNAADAERFVITSEESVSKGVRRIVALTGAAAVEAANHATLSPP